MLNFTSNDDFRYAESRGADVIGAEQVSAVNMSDVAVAGTRQLPCGGGPWTTCRETVNESTVQDHQFNSSYSDLERPGLDYVTAVASNYTLVSVPTHCLV